MIIQNIRNGGLTEMEKKKFVCVWKHKSRIMFCVNQTTQDRDKYFAVKPWTTAINYLLCYKVNVSRVCTVRIRTTYVIHIHIFPLQMIH